MTICLLDPGIGNNQGAPSDNLGDLIIQDAVLREIHSIFGDQNIIRFSTHVPPEDDQFKLMQSCSHILVGGTNLLSSNMNQYNQWKIWLLDAFRIKRAILLGISWWQYQGRPNLYTQILLKAALSNKAIHSVRDGYSEQKLKSIGIKNVINTGCPTMWPLANLRPGDIPTQKADNALIMLTDYSQQPQLDRELLQLAVSQYQRVFVWPQGKGDRDYLASLIAELNMPVALLDYSMNALEEFIGSGIAFDYIGTRLHGGIRCLLAGKRSLILAIDHRAKEIAQETGLPTAERDDLAYINYWISSAATTQIRMNVAAINQWKSQFTDSLSGRSPQLLKATAALQ